MIKRFESFNNSGKLMKIHIDVRNCSDEQKMEILNILEDRSEDDLRFNGENSKEKFITNRDTQGLAWCWTVRLIVPYMNAPLLYNVNGKTPGYYLSDCKSG